VLADIFHSILVIGKTPYWCRTVLVVIVNPNLHASLITGNRPGSQQPSNVLICTDHLFTFTHY